MWNVDQNVNQTIYIDSCIIDAYLWGKKGDKECAKRIYYNVKKTIDSNSKIKVIIPLIVVGEIVNTMIQKGKKNKIDEMFKLIEDLKADTPPPNKEIIETSLHILEEDKRFQPTDAIIAAHALCDEYSAHLLTADQNMINSRAVNDPEDNYLRDKQEKKKQKQELKIASDL